MTGNGVKMAVTSQAYLEGSQVKQTKSLITDLCRLFYTLGWVSGTGGSITAKVHDDSLPKSDQLIIMSPSGVQKERMVEEDMYVLSSVGDVLFSPLPKPYPHKPPKCSDCAPLFLKAYHMRNAGAVIHSHGMESCLVTMLDPLAKEFRITHMEMIKGIQGHGYYDELVVPIIENTAHERELTESLAAAIEAYPKTTAVLVRNHGIYVWGDSWISAKTQAECYHYLFDAAIKLHQLGIDWSTPSHGPIQRSKPILGGQTTNTSQKRCIVLDIEGTTTPITFVTDVLFPYARNNVQRHLEETYDTDFTQDDIKLLRSQVEDDLQHGVVGAVPIPSDEAGKQAVIAALVANVEGMIKSDRKITSLKHLQSHIWRTGFEKNELKGVVFDDVPGALEKWHASGIKVTLVDWWLTKPQSDHHSQTLGVAGFTSQQNRPTRCFSSAPILKIFDLFELETVDGVCIILQGFINKDRTLLNGFSPQLFDHFIIGFPPNWNDYSPKLESASKSVSSLFFQQNDGKDSTQEYCLFHGKPQNSDGYDVDTGVKHCNDMMFNYKSSTLINPSSVEIPHEHIIEAGNEVLCERSPVTSEFKDDPSLEMGPTVSNTVDSSMRANCLGVSSRRMTRSVKKLDNSKNSFPVINDKSNLDKRTLIGPGTLGSSANLNKKAVNVVDCDMKSKSKSIDSQSSGGNECERSLVTPEFKDDQSLEMSPIEHIIEAGNEVLCERSTVTPEFKDAPSLETSPIVSNTVESSTQQKFLGISSRRMTRSMKKLDNSKNSFPQINDISNLDKKTLIDPGILVSSENLNKKAVNVDCDMKSKSRHFDTKSSGGCGKGSNETVSCSEDSVIKMKLKRTPFDQNGDVITKDKRNKDDADVSGESQINMRITDVNDDIAIVKTIMKGCRNKKRNKVDMPQKEGLPATHGTSSKDTVMNGNRSKTKLPVKRKLMSSPKAKSTSLRGKKGSKERNESANILSIESFSAKKSRSGRVVLPPLEFWRNQKVVYDEDREMCGVQEPK